MTAGLKERLLLLFGGASVPLLVVVVVVVVVGGFGSTIVISMVEQEIASPGAFTLGRNRFNLGKTTSTRFDEFSENFPRGGGCHFRSKKFGCRFFR